MQNKTVFLTVMAIFAYSAFKIWQGTPAEGYSLLRLISLALILAGMALIAHGQMKSFIRKIKKNGKG